MLQQGGGGAATAAAVLGRTPTIAGPNDEEHAFVGRILDFGVHVDNADRVHCDRMLRGKLRLRSTIALAPPPPLATWSGRAVHQLIHYVSSTKSLWKPVKIPSTATTNSAAGSSSSAGKLQYVACDVDTRGESRYEYTRMPTGPADASYSLVIATPLMRRVYETSPAADSKTTSTPRPPLAATLVLALIESFRSIATSGTGSDACASIATSSVIARLLPLAPPPRSLEVVGKTWRLQRTLMFQSKPFPQCHLEISCDHPPSADGCATVSLYADEPERCWQWKPNDHIWHTLLQTIYAPLMFTYSAHASNITPVIQRRDHPTEDEVIAAKPSLSEFLSRFVDGDAMGALHRLLQQYSALRETTRTDGSTNPECELRLGHETESGAYRNGVIDPGHFKAIRRALIACVKSTSTTFTKDSDFQWNLVCDSWWKDTIRGHVVAGESALRCFEIARVANVDLRITNSPFALRWAVKNERRRRDAEDDPIELGAPDHVHIKQQLHFLWNGHRLTYSTTAVSATAVTTAAAADRADAELKTSPELCCITLTKRREGPTREAAISSKHVVFECEMEILNTYQRQTEAETIAAFTEQMLSLVHDRWSDPKTGLRCSLMLARPAAATTATANVHRRNRDGHEDGGEEESSSSHPRRHIKAVKIGGGPKAQQRLPVL